MRVLAIVLFVAAVAIRIWATGEARFTGDETEQWATARSIATFERAPIFGPSITGSPARLPGPIYYYFAAIPQLLGSSPRLGGIFIALLHALAGLLIAKLALDARSPRAALTFLALFAFAPWDVLYGDRVWSACVTPLLGTFAIYAAVKSRDDSRWQGVLLFISLILPQLHFSAPMCWAACAVILILRPPVRWSKAALALGFLAAFLTYAPALISELQTGFQNTRAILTHSGGKESVSYTALSPVKTVFYAVIFGSSDIEYQLQKGYWGGGFDDLAAYLLTWSWDRLPRFISIALALVGWIVAFVVAVPKIRKRELEGTLVAAIVVGYVVGAVLLVFSRKLFFPHYVSLLLPAALLPIVFGLDRLRTPLLVAGCVISVGSMAYETVRYYRLVDSLNGVNVTLDMVGAALEEKKPIALSFAGYPNDYAWREVARVHHRRPLSIDPRAEVRLRVHNRARFSGEELPPNARLFDGVLLERIEVQQARPAGLVARASENLAAMRVDVVHSDGKTRTCSPAPCRYGDQPWQELRPEPFEMAGRRESLLFMHPVERGRVKAVVPVPRGAHRGTLRFGLSDSATRSDNKAPVDVSLFVDEKNVAKGNATNEPGLKSLPFVLSSTSAAVSIEIFTEKDGARVFGFDVDFFD